MGKKEERVVNKSLGVGDYENDKERSNKAPAANDSLHRAGKSF